jgi:hypothetical protein
MVCKIFYIFFDVEKIKTAIEIVENFKIKLDEVIVKEDGCIIEKDMLEDINKEFINLYLLLHLNRQVLSAFYSLLVIFEH